MLSGGMSYCEPPVAHHATAVMTPARSLMFTVRLP